jgi:hypothetical protein
MNSNQRDPLGLVQRRTRTKQLMNMKKSIIGWAGALAMPVALFAAGTAQAGSSTWTTPTEYPSDNTPPWPDWNDSSHWNAGIIPNGVGEIATFDALTNRLNFRITDFSNGAALPGNATSITLGQLVHTGGGRLDSRPYGPVSTIVWDNGASNAVISDTFNGEFLLAHNHTLTSTLEITRPGGQTRLQQKISGPGGIILSGNQEFVLGETGIVNTFEGGVTVLDTCRIDVRRTTATGTGAFTFTSTSTANSRITPRNNWSGGAFANKIVVEAGGFGWIRDEGGDPDREFSGALTGGGAMKLDSRNSLWMFTGTNMLSGTLTVVGDGAADLLYGVAGVFNTNSSIVLDNAAVFHITAADVFDDSATVTLDATSFFNVGTGLNEGIGSGLLTVDGAVIADGAYTNAEPWIEGDGTITVGASGSFPLTITPAVSPATGYDLKWESQAGMLYDVLSTGDLSEPLVDWDVVEAGIVATPDENTKNVTPVESSLFFRVREYPPPPVELWSENFDLASAPTLPVGWESGAYAGNAGTTAWILGIPTGAATGPSTAFSPDNCVGTNIAGDYLTDANIWLRTPAIDLTGETGAKVVFKEWVDIDDFNLLDIGTVRILDADDLPGTVTVLAVVAANIQGLDPIGWVELSADIPDALGNIVVEFLFESDNDPTDDSSGWYIDDVAVTVDP